MFRHAAAALACLAVTLAWQTVAARAADDPFIGTWQVNHDGYNEIWTIAKDKDDWSISGVFKEKGNEVGSWKGGDVKVADGELTCTQKWAKKPDPTWSDNTQLKAVATGDKLIFVWDSGGGNSGKREMTRVKAAAADGADLVGVWKADHDGFTEMLAIQMEKGQWDVKGIFLKKGKEVGAYVGTNPKFADGKLTCVQKYLAKPVPTWNDGVTLTAQSSNDKLELGWDAGNGQAGSHEMTKVSK